MTQQEALATVRAMAGPKKRGRKPSTYASVADLNAWMKRQPPVCQVIVIRTSASDKGGFGPMFKAGIAMLPDHPDVQALGAIGAGIVTDAGAPERARLGAYELRRGSVPGGKGYALLGYALVIGSTLFILYLQTARCADIPGATRDQTRNAFTEALCILLRHFRPVTCYTPLVNRVFRNMDFAQQVLRTLRELNIALVAEGAQIPLGTGDSDLMALLKAWFAAREADGLVSRLGNIEIGIYLDQQWYLGEGTLPFTWQTKSRTELNALTGVSVRVVEDRHELEAIEAAKPILHAFLQKAAQQTQSRRQIGMFLGSQGVISRAPRHFGKNVRLDSAPHTSLAANGATTLLQERWLTAWETGSYRRTIRLKADPRPAMPELTDRVIDVDGQLFLEIETPMPAPAGGWGVEVLCAQARDRIRRDAQSPQSTARKSKTGQQKPLNHLCDYDLDGVNRALTSIGSKELYELRYRPVAEAYDEHGHKLAWLKTDRWICSIPAEKLHASVAAAITEAIGDLEGLTAPLMLHPSTLTTPTVDPLVVALDAVREELATAGARLAGIKANRQQLEGLLVQRPLTANESEQLDELPADEDLARAQRRAAQQQEALLARQLTEVPATTQTPPPADASADADFAVIDLVAAALAGTTYRAPDALNELLSRVLHDFRVTSASHGAAVTWTATLVVPLVDGGDAEFHLHSAAPIANAKNPPRRPGSLDTAALTPQTLAQLFMLEAREQHDIGTERGVRRDGAPSSFLFRRTIDMLVDHLGVTPGLAAAAADMPAALRPLLYQALTATGALDDPWQRHLRAVYRNQESFGPTWCMGYHHEARKVIRYLEQHATDPFHGLPSAQVAAGAEVPYQRLIAFTIAGRQAQTTRGTTYGRGPLLDKDFGVGARGNIALLQCAHKDCLARVVSGQGGVLIPIATPETTSTHGRAGEQLLGVVCRSCRRLPGLPEVILPMEYLQEWVGGRRQQVTDGPGTRWIGSHLAPLPT